MAIEWEHLDQRRFDRIVESLIHRMYGGAGDVQAIDGRGGDVGRDIVVTQGRRQRIFQLKFFPGGFSAAMGPRRRQIKKSFERALQHAPYEWILVVPCNLTPSEREFIDELGNGRDVRVSVMDRAALDARISTFPDLVDYYTRDQLMEAAKVYQQEKAVLLGGQGDLVDRMRALGQRVDSCDPNWTFDFARRGDVVVNTLRPKHPRAHEVSPVQIRLDGVLGKEHAELASAIDRSLGYGTDDTVVLPPEAVQRLTIEGPEWLSATYEQVQVTWTPLRNSARRRARIELRFVDEEGRTLVSHEGQMRYGGSGGRGYTLRASFHNVVDVTFLVPRGHGAGTLNYSLDVSGASASDTLQAVALARCLHRRGSVQVYVDGNRQGTLALNPSRSPQHAERLAEMDELEQFATDLDVVQRHCQAYFTVPKSLSGPERIALRVARLLIEGCCVVHPEARVLTITLNGSDGPALRQLLGGAPVPISVNVSEFMMDIANRRLLIGEVTIFHTRLIALDHQTALDHLDAGTAAGHTVRLRPDGEEHFSIFMPGKWGDDNKPLRVTPWGLPGLAEPGTAATSSVP